MLVEKVRHAQNRVFSGRFVRADWWKTTVPHFWEGPRPRPQVWCVEGVGGFRVSAVRH